MAQFFKAFVIQFLFVWRLYLLLEFPCGSTFSGIIISTTVSYIFQFRYLCIRIVSFQLQTYLPAVTIELYNKIKKCKTELQF